jgi:hypothetical protein
MGAADIPLDRVAERRRAAALARHYRDNEDLPIAEIARRLGRPPPQSRTYLYDPTGEKARAVKARYRGYCRHCRPRRPAAQMDPYARTRGNAPLAELYGRAPSSYDWSGTHAERRGAQALRRLEQGEWPSPATVSELYGTWAAALSDAFTE